MTYIDAIEIADEAQKIAWRIGAELVLNRKKLAALGLTEKEIENLATHFRTE
jgi:hypothetical protein